MSLKLTQTIRHFDHDDDGRPVVLRVIEPSEPYGYWPGNAYEIREWTISRKAMAMYERCLADEVEQFEEELGETKVKFVEHPTLGQVATPK